MFKSIVVAIDTQHPESWKKALPEAIALAQEGQAQLTLATVVPDFRTTMDAEWSATGYQQMSGEARARLTALKVEFDGAGAAKIAVESGSIWRGVVAIAERAHADLIVLASHRPEIKDYLFGTNAARIVMHAACSVLVVRD